MRYDDLRPQIKTGDLLLCDGNGLVSGIIELFTHGLFSHVAVFFWIGDGLFIAEEWQTAGFQIMPASQKIAQADGKCYWGQAPGVVRANPDAVNREISLYRTDRTKQPYGWETLIKVFNCDEFGAVIDPDKVQAVCSVFASLCWSQAGYPFKTLVSPADLGRLVTNLTLIE